MKITAIKTRLFKPSENLEQFIHEHIPSLPNSSVLVVTSKILSLAQNQVVSKSKYPDKKVLVREQADRILCESYKSYLTIKDGHLIAAAGIDESNAEENYILWPKNIFIEAQSLWKSLRAHYKVKDLGILFSDSRSQPLRRGVTGLALGYWGFEGLQNHVGKTDLFGREITMSSTNAADCLTSAAILCMGETNESKPLALIENADVTFQSETDKNELVMELEKDLFAPLFKI